MLTGEGFVGASTFGPRARGVVLELFVVAEAVEPFEVALVGKATPGSATLAGAMGLVFVFAVGVVVDQERVSPSELVCLGTSTSLKDCDLFGERDGVVGLAT